jgi:ribosomal protein L3 glutamine methyltransferase
MNIQQEVCDELITVRDCLRWASSQFQAAELYYGHGTDNPWDEAFALVLHALHLPHTADPLILDARLTRRERLAIADLFQRRIQDCIPVAYLTKEAWFGSLKLYVDERVLIPRSPLAETIDHQFSPWIEPGRVHRILDLCTGSGCIAFACAHAFPDAQVDAVDVSPEALEVAKINIKNLQLETQVKLIQSDLFSALMGARYDVIISNPPYVAALPAEYQHEPELGLAAGEDGLLIVKRILQEADQYLSPQGILIVEVGNSEAALVEQFPDVPFTWLEFERGGGGVFLLTAKQVTALSTQMRLT